jgi:hypothetical protein
MGAMQSPEVLTPEAVKRCGRCGQSKPLSEYYKHGATKKSYCKVCALNYNRAWTEKNKDRVRERSAEWREKNRERFRDMQKAWREKNPEKQRELVRQWAVENSARRYQQAGAWNKRTRQDPKHWVRMQLSQVKARAKKIGVEFSLDAAQVETPKFCPVLGIELTYGLGTGIRKNPHAASLDRIVGSRGYSNGNVRVISLRANVIKSDATLEELRALVKYLEGLDV